jgi:hypothetical protein
MLRTQHYLEIVGRRRLDLVPPVIDGRFVRRPQLVYSSVATATPVSTPIVLGSIVTALACLWGLLDAKAPNGPKQ